MTRPPTERPAGRIPVPLARRLGHLRRRALPLVLFIGLVAAIGKLWTEHVLTATLIGEVVAQRAEIIAPGDGRLVQVPVQAFSRVQRGDPLAVVLTADPALLEAQLAVIRAEADLLRYTFDPLIGRQRSDLDYQRLRVELMDQRAAQAAGEVRLLQAGNERQRARLMHAEGLIPLAELERIETEHDALEVGIAGQRALVASLQQELDRLGLPEGGQGEQPILAAIRVHEERLRLVEAELAPVVISAPFTGQVGRILRGPGEHVLAGEPLMTVMAETGDRILAYMRQPIRVEPEVGMTVRVQGPSRDPRTGLGRVLHVAAQLEPLPEMLLGPGLRPEMALPVVISLPAGIDARPGERLELSLLP